jgi:hypothetical protein
VGEPPRTWRPEAGEGAGAASSVRGLGAEESGETGSGVPCAAVPVRGSLRLRGSDLVLGGLGSPSHWAK